MRTRLGSWVEVFSLGFGRGGPKEGRTSGWCSLEPALGGPSRGEKAPVRIICNRPDGEGIEG